MSEDEFIEKYPNSLIAYDGFIAMAQLPLNAEQTALLISLLDPISKLKEAYNE